MAYATPTEFGARYTTRLSETELSSHFLPFASARLDSLLAPFFTVPFSSNNLTAKDCTIDLAYLLILQRSRDPQEYGSMQTQMEGRLRALAEGAEAMVTDSGETLLAATGRGLIWSNTGGDGAIFSIADSGGEGAL